MPHHVGEAATTLILDVTLTSHMHHSYIGRAEHKSEIKKNVMFMPIGIRVTEDSRAIAPTLFDMVDVKIPYQINHGGQW